ncbi:LacI family transcriptional regulator [Aequitasia blattaphilus]|uniref:LacI family transcriptional regulator n=1 Tax=Aequitasia blattaphilus TaxID=2949332 RepID=A0ABT1EA30_9FIRM|nr:LacI family DNA-binding transcriptional regulator [Aequitasia blattaphilus]MCP1102688.1 LacI family transcriptional regulator [Aequitasia blattaphilus]MCR8615328.1 LacI family transcriptional regulator [Aequitasia blattaphilus]
MGETTIDDIAKEAGVSKATVSRVINNSSSVAPDTREKIQAIIDKRHYSPSAVARGLSKRTSSTIGVVVPEVDNPFFGEILRGVTEIIDRNNLSLICCNSDDDSKKDYKALEMLKENRVRGLLYTPATDYSDKKQKKRLEKLLNEIDTPVVLLDRKIGLDFDGVYFDDRQGIYDATQALIKGGHTKIGIINGTLDRVLARIRQDGYLEALRDAGIEPEERYMFFGDFRMGTSYKLSSQLLSMEDRPTAVLTCNNRTSMGFFKALFERGESMPKDIVCIGLDRIEALELFQTDFVYIKRDAFKMGRKAMELLISRMAFPDKPISSIILDAPLSREDAESLKRFKK